MKKNEGINICFFSFPNLITWHYSLSNLLKQNNYNSNEKNYLYTLRLVLNYMIV